MMYTTRPCTRARYLYRTYDSSRSGLADGSTVGCRSLRRVAPSRTRVSERRMLNEVARYEIARTQRSLNRYRDASPVQAASFIDSSYLSCLERMTQALDGSAPSVLLASSRSRPGTVSAETTARVPAGSSRQQSDRIYRPSNRITCITKASKSSFSSISSLSFVQWGSDLTIRFQDSSEGSGRTNFGLYS